MILWNSVILIVILKIEIKAYDMMHNEFFIEPSPRVEFLATNGIGIVCKVRGHPSPEISWQTRDGVAAENIPGLRYMRSSGTLVFPPFSAADYKKEIHDTFYQCIATNTVGTMISRKVHVLGVIEQIYNPEVENVYVRRGDTAVLTCRIPTFVEKYVSVDSWIRSDGHVLKMTDTNRTHTVLLTGELLIYETKDTDSDWGYRCQTRYRLTREMTISTKEAKIYVGDPRSLTLPRVTFKKDKISAEEGSETQLPCVAEGNPSPTYRWMKDVNGDFRPVKEDSRIWLVQGTLNIRKVYGSDEGKYQCIIHNDIGEKRIDSSLIVRAPLSARLLPPYHLQILRIGQDDNLTCTISGYPVHNVSWKKDGVPIVPSKTFQYLSRNVLHISSIQRIDMGMYQCFVDNDIDNAQGAMEIKMPVPLQWRIEPENSTVVVGNTVWFNAATKGSPQSLIRWLKLPHTDLHLQVKIRTDIVTDDTETLIIIDAKEADGGEYLCEARNSFDTLSKIFYLQVLVPPRFIHSVKEIVAAEGRNVTLVCHVIGDPPITISWEKNESFVEDKSNHRYFFRIISMENGTISELHIFNATRSDTGEYTCAAVSDIGKNETIIELYVGTPNPPVSLKNEMDLEFHRIITIMAYVVVSFLAILGLLFPTFIYFRIQLQEKRLAMLSWIAWSLRGRSHGKESA